MAPEAIGTVKLSVHAKRHVIEGGEEGAKKDVFKFDKRAESSIAKGYNPLCIAFGWA